MPLEYSPALNANDYDELLKSFLQALEGAELNPYIDTVGVPTIGWGFALDDAHAVPNRLVQDSIIQSILGINDPDEVLTNAASVRETFFQDQLIGVLNRVWTPDNTRRHTGSSETLRNELNALLRQRQIEIANHTNGYTAADELRIGVVSTEFTYSNLAQVEQTFDAIRGVYDGRLDNAIDGPRIPDTRERIALFCMTYQGAMSPEFRATLNAALAMENAHDARAEAWYVARYEYLVRRTPRRAYMEAAMFGITTPGQVMDDDGARAIYRMWTRHSEQMLALEAANASALTEAQRSLGELATASNLTVTFQPFANYLVDHYGQGRGFDALAIFVTENAGGNVNQGTESDAVLLIGGDGKDTLQGGTGNDVIDGGGEADTLSGGLGDDIIHGGGGNDAIRGGGDGDTLYGGADNDFLYAGDGTAHGPNPRGPIKRNYLFGEDGFDEYHVSTGDGVVEIYDADASGILYWNGVPLTNLERVSEVAECNVYRCRGLVNADATWDPVGGTLTIRFVGSSDVVIIHTRDPNAPATSPATLTASTDSDPFSPFSFTAFDFSNGFNFELASLTTATNSFPDVGLGITFEEAEPVNTPLTYDLQHYYNIMAAEYHAPGTQVWGYSQNGFDSLFWVTPQISTMHWLGREHTYAIQLYAEIASTNPDFNNPHTLNNTTAFGAEMRAGNGASVMHGGAQSDVMVADVAGYNGLMADNLDRYGQRTGDDHVYGEGGDDVLYGYNGNDVLDGGSGDDVLMDDYNGYVIDGALTNGHAVRISDDYINSVLQGYSNDVLIGGSGNDNLFASRGDDVLDGGDGNDTLFGGAHDDTLAGGAGDDRLFGDVWLQTHFATESEWSRGEGSTWRWHSEETAAGADYLDGGAGNDQLYGGGNNDVLIGGDGNDELFGHGGLGENVIVNGPENASTDNDYLDGGAGDDRLFGDGGQDVLFGGDGDDTVVGDYGSDRANEGDNDELHGGDGNDVLVALAGDDALYGDAGNDRLEGGIGNDILHGGSGTDELTGGDGDDVLYADSNENGGTEILQGDAGNDVLYGSEAADYLNGGDDNDVLSGGGGNDNLVGGAGNDTYLIETGSGHDIINDSQGHNHVQLNGFNASTLQVFINGGVVLIQSGSDIVQMNADTFAMSSFSVGGIAMSTTQLLSRVVLPTNLTDHTVHLNADINPYALELRAVGNDLQLIYRPSTVNGATALSDTPTAAEAAAASNWVDVQALLNQGIPCVLQTDAEGNSVLTLSNYYTAPSALAYLSSLSNGTQYVNLAFASLSLERYWNGSETDDTLITGDQNDTVTAQSGNDYLQSGNGNDTLNGGTGDDIIDGGNGDDTYVINRGDGRDVIIDAQGNDTLRFGEGISASNIEVHETNAGLQIVLARDAQGNIVDEVLLSNWLRGASNQIENFQFSDGSILTATQLAQLITGNRAPELITPLANVQVTYGDNFSFVIPAQTFADDGGALTYVLRQSNGQPLPDGLNFDAQTGTLSGIYQPESLASLNLILYAIDSAGLYQTASFAVQLQNGTSGDDANNTMNGDTDNNALDGMNGNDVLNGLAGQDLLLGGAGDDTLNGGEGDDRLFGGDGNDRLNGDAGNDRLMGGAGNDIIRGGAGDNVVVINANDGVDTVYHQIGATQSVQLGAGLNLSDAHFYWSNNGLLCIQFATGQQINLAGLTGFSEVAGESARDAQFLFASANEMSVQFASGEVLDISALIARANIATSLDDRLLGSSGDDTIHAGAGVDRVYGGNGLDFINGESNDDYLYGNAGNDTLDGGDGNDFLVGGTTSTDNDASGADVMFGAAGNDILYGGDGNDQLSGGSENDRLYGGDGNDIIDGGTGDDRLNGGFGQDTYIFRRGDGVDRILRTGNAVGYQDILRLVDYNANDVILGRVGNDLVVLFTTGADKIVIEGYFESAAYQLNSIQFADGSNWSSTTIDQNAAILGSEDADSYRGSTSADYYRGRAGDDFIQGDNGNDRLYGEDGNDEIYGEAGNDLLVGGVGNDSLYGGFGVDTYELGLGDGHDRIDAFDGLNSDGTWDRSVDIIKLGAGISLADLSVEQVGNDLVVHYSGNDAFTLSQFYNHELSRTVFVQLATGQTLSSDQLMRLASHATDSNDAIVGDSDNEMLFGMNGDDHISGGDGDDSLYGEQGNDVLTGGEGYDQFFIQATNGQDIITDFVIGTDRVNLDEAPENITLLRSGNDLLMLIGQGADQVTLSNYFMVPPADAQSTVVTFANGTQWTAEYVSSHLSQATSNDDVIEGDEQSNEIHALAGNDTVTGNGGNDILFGDNGNDLLYGGAGYDTLVGGAGNDKLFGGDEGDDLRGDSGDDVLDGGNDGDMLSGGAGNDTLIGGSGQDAFYFGLGDGHDVITDFENVFEGANDYVQLNLSQNQVKLTRTGNNLIVTINSSGERLTITNYFTQDDAVVDLDGQLAGLSFNDDTMLDYNAVLAAVRTVTTGDDYLVGTSANNTINANNGNDTVYGRGGDDNLSGGAGNDQLFGETGNDTLYGNTGNDTLYGGVGGDRLYGDGTATATTDGADTIYGEAGADTIYAGRGDDIVDGGDDNDIIYGAVSNSDTAASGNDTLRGGNGDDQLYGNDGNDVLFGDAGVDTIKGGNGNDQITGGAGNDTLTGGAGNDTWFFGRGDGQDIVIATDTATSRTDRIQLAAGIATSDIRLSRVGNNLIIQIIGSTDQINVQNYYSSTSNRITDIRFDNGTLWNQTQIQNIINAGGTSSVVATTPPIKVFDEQLFARDLWLLTDAMASFGSNRDEALSLRRTDDNQLIDWAVQTGKSMERNVLL